MNIKELIIAPRYGVYKPKSKFTQTVEYTPLGTEGFKISATLILGDKDTFEKVGESLNEYVTKSKDYLKGKDLGLLASLLGTGSKVLTYVIKFDKDGITLASAITLNTECVQFIYEKYNKKEYALQLALTQKSTLKFAWSDSKLEGDFYFNMKRSGKLDYTTITGYTDFHLGNKNAKKPVSLSAGIVKKIPITANDNDTKPDKVDHTYVMLQSKKGLSIADIISMVTTNSVDIPDALDKVVINSFGVLKVKGKDNKSLALVLDCNIKINNNTIKTKLSIISETTETNGDKTTSFTFKGVATVGEHRFNLEFKSIKKGKEKKWAILATYDSGNTKTTIKFRNLATSLFGESIQESVPDVKIELQSFKAFFYYQKAKESKKNKLLLGMGAGLDISMKDLPMAGGVLVKMDALKFKEVLVVYGKGTLEKNDLKQLKVLKQLPKDFTYKEGLSVVADLIVAGESKLHTIGGSNTTQEKKKSNLKGAGAAEDTGDTGETAKEVLEKKAKEEKAIPKGLSSKAKWSKINKTIGPVNLQRLGIAFVNGKIVMLLDASIKMKGLGANLMGLGVGFNLEWPPKTPDFYLEGMGLSMSFPAISISAAFMRTQKPYKYKYLKDGKTIKKETFINVYNGQALLKLSKFSIAAIGSYAKVPVNETETQGSLFIYGVFKGNIGGPPFFFVTGIAAGFGYNRKINTPDLDEVAEYPLVALAMGTSENNDDIDTVLTSLETPMKSGKKPIEISVGDYWLAVGIKFTSFKIVDSFVLLTVNFGTQLEFAILGLSRISWPPKEISVGDPMVYIELAIIAHFGPDSDVISVDGIITSNSYIFSKDCRLTGGFAFYTWISGEHAGDFVITIGGYHPKYPKPIHYPSVDRILLHWQLSEELLIKGSMYYALTPSCMMMGGSMAILFQTDILKVTFLMWLDILVAWAPFSYSLEIGIIIKIEAYIKKCFISFYLNFELHTMLQIWGPPFSGKATLDTGVYSFEFKFGSTNNETPILAWKDFSDMFLPKKKEQQQDGKELQKTDALSIQASEGVIETREFKLKDDTTEKIFITNPHNPKFIIETSLPVKKLFINPNNETSNAIEHTLTDTQSYKNKINTIGVRPCDIAPEDLDSVMEITFTCNDVIITENTFQFAPLEKTYPVSLWGSQKEKGKDFEKEQLISGVVSGVCITPSPTTDVVEMKPYDFSKFLTKYSELHNVKTTEIGQSDKYHSYDVYGNDEETGYLKKYKGEKVKETRDNILNALKDFDNDFFDIDEEGVDRTLNDPENYFRGIPILCDTALLPQYPQNTNA